MISLYYPPLADGLMFLKIRKVTHWLRVYFLYKMILLILLSYWLYWLLIILIVDYDFWFYWYYLLYLSSINLIVIPYISPQCWFNYGYKLDNTIKIHSKFNKNTRDQWRSVKCYYNCIFNNTCIFNCIQL